MEDKRVLEGIAPEKLFYFFEELTRIPRGSGNEQAVSDYLVTFAKKRNLKVRQDDANNVVIWQEGTTGYEDHAPVIIQGHMDMVCVKDEDCSIDLEKDSLDLCVNGDEIYAKGTSLGGDDGIAVAMALAIMDDDTIPHPPLEVIVTTDEEVGMTGASKLDVAGIEGRALLNIDSEDEGVLTAGCAGGMRVDHVLDVRRENSTGYSYRIIVDGLKGGHSGVEIDKGRGNAVVLLGRFLQELIAHFEESFCVQLINYKGGEKDNAIPLLASADILVQIKDKEKQRGQLEANNDAITSGLCAYADEYTRILKNEYALTDCNVSLRVEAINDDSASDVMAVCVEDTQVIADIIVAMPNGIQCMSAAIPGLPETSLNLGILELKDDALYFSQSLRSAVASKKDALFNKISTIAKLAGARTSSRGAYPAWEFKKDSPLRELVTAKYKELFGSEMKVDIIHAGLECGLLSEKLPGLDAISIGPDLSDIHTTSEKLHIESTKRTFELVKAVLASM